MYIYIQCATLAHIDYSVTKPKMGGSVCCSVWRCVAVSCSVLEWTVAMSVTANTYLSQCTTLAHVPCTLES